MPCDEGAEDGFPFADEHQMAKLWDLGRKELLAKCPSGSRPWAWWRFDAKAPGELRAMLRGTMDEIEGEIIAGFPAEGAVFEPWDAIAEPDWRFLERHGLLTAEERDLLPAWQAELAAELAEFDEDHRAIEERVRAEGACGPGCTPGEHNSAAEALVGPRIRLIKGGADDA
jgi:hypothetical protein